MPTLNWVGRKDAVRADKDVVMKILREDKSLSYGDPKSDNILVHGDNLEALKAPLPFYAGRVKCIYIDPPYNTGSAFEHYDDNLEHSTWLDMMYPRLKMLKEFLSEDGSIWISIDDREGAYLRVICDEIFGRQNFVSNVSWQRTYSTRNDAKGIVNEVEHILVYAKREGWQPKKLPRTAEMDKKYKNPDGDPNGSWRNDNAYAPDAKTHQGMVYAIQHPFTGELLYPTSSSCWRYEQSVMLTHMNGWCPYELREIDDAEKRATICGVSVDEVRKGVKAIVLKNLFQTGLTGFTGLGAETENPVNPVNPVGNIPASFAESRKMATEFLKQGPWPKFSFSKNGQGGIARKTYLSAVGEVPPTNLFEYEDVGHTDEAKKEVLKVFDGQSLFATPKPERLIQRVLTIATNPGDLVMDSFLGSGTTAAVAQKMGRRWIGIEMGEHAKTHCAVRLKKVVDGEQGGISKQVGWQGGGGFRFYELGEPMLDENGAISEGIEFDTLAAHIWWRETGAAWNLGSADARERVLPKSTALGVYKGVAYALLYNGVLHDRSVSGGNVLTAKTLRIIREDLGAARYSRLVVYGECTKMGAAKLREENVEFRQTPYDIVTRR